MKIKNTNTNSVLLSVEPSVSLMAGEVIEANGQLAEDALKIKGVVETKEKVGINTPKAKKGSKKDEK